MVMVTRQVRFTYSEGHNSCHAGTFCSPEVDALEAVRVITTLLHGLLLLVGQTHHRDRGSDCLLAFGLALEATDRVHSVEAVVSNEPPR